MCQKHTTHLLRGRTCRALAWSVGIPRLSPVREKGEALSTRRVSSHCLVLNTPVSPLEDKEVIMPVVRHLMMRQSTCSISCEYSNPNTPNDDRS